MNYGHGANREAIARKYQLSSNELIDYSSNINAYQQPKWLKKVYLDNFINIREYPDIHYLKLIQACAQYENINASKIMLGNGASCLIFDLVRIINPKKATILIPTFSEYERALVANDCDIQFVPLNKQLKDVKKQIDKHTECIFICNPNNPTGQLISKLDLIAFMDDFKDAWVIIDESFMDFCEVSQSCQSTLDCYPKLVIIKSYTKFFQCAGLRFGIAMSSNQSLKTMYEKQTPPWAINGLVSDIIIHYLNDEKFIHGSRIDNLKNRKWLSKALTELGLRVYDSQANFLCFETADKTLFEKLLQRKLIIRDCQNFRGAKQGLYRVCVSLPEKNQTLISTLKEVLYEEV